MEKNKKYSGMSLNEMLFESGLLTEFDNAVKDRNKMIMLEILKKVGINKDNANQIIKTIFDNPKKYGFE